MSSKKLASLIIRITANGAQAESELRKMERKVQDFGKSVKRVGDSMTKYVTVPLTALAALSVKVADTQLQAEAKLLNALRGRKDVQQRLIAQASELQSRSLFGDEAIIEQQAYLAALGLSERQINDTIEAAAQLSAALGMDLTSAVKNLAKTYGGMTGKLGESVPALKELTKEQLKAGEAIKFVNDNYKGFAETAAQTGAGALVQLKNKMGDLAEKIGVILLPVMDKLIDLATRLVDYLSSLSPATQKWLVSIGALAAGIGPLLSIGAKLILNFDRIVAVIPRIGSALTWLAAHPIVAVTAALAALVAQTIRANRQLENFKKQIQDEGRAEKYQEAYAEYSRPIYSDEDLRERLRATNKIWKETREGYLADGGKIDEWEAYLLNLWYEESRALTDILEERRKAAEDAAAIQKTYANALEETNPKIDEQAGLIGKLQEKIAALEDKKLLATSKVEIGAINLELATLNKELEQLKNYTPAFERVGGIATNGVSFGVSAPSDSALEGFIPNAALERYQSKLDKMQELTERTAGALNATIQNMAVSFVNVIGDGIEAMVAGEKFDWLPRFLEFIGSALRQLGTALVAYATAMEAFEAAFENPWVALAAGVGAIAAGSAVLGWAKKLSKTPKLATGGLAYGPTLAVVGDNVGAAHDPEVIAPLSKLRSYMGTQRLELVGDIEWKMRGDTLRAVLNKENIRLVSLG